MNIAENPGKNNTELACYIQYTNLRQRRSEKNEVKGKKRHENGDAWQNDYGSRSERTNE